MTLIRKLLLRHRNNRKISRAIRRGVLLGVASLVFAAPAYGNPVPVGEELIIYPGGSAQARGFAYGSERTDARIYYYGVYHGWVGCYRSTFSVHLWICNGLYVPPGNGGFAEIAYDNAYGWSYGYTPWVLSSNQTLSATTGVLG